MNHPIYQKLTISSTKLLTHFQYIHQNPIFTLTKPFSSSLPSPSSNVVKYLVKSCGVTPTKAKILANKYNIKNIENSKTFVEFLKKNGFTTNHIGKIVSWDPRWLKCRSPERTLMPKFEFLYSIGVSKDSLGDIICGCTTILTRSLDKVVKSCYDRLRSVGFSDNDVVMLLKRRPWLFLDRNGGGGDDNFVVNVRFLRKIGVPQSKIVYLVGLRADVVFLDHVELCKCVDEVVGFGFDVEKTGFLWALCGNYNDRNKGILERSFVAYEKWGWSRDDCLFAFRKYPQSMFLSEENIATKMDFFVNKIGIESREVSKCSLVLCYSLERRISPRFSVVCVLERKGLLNKSRSLSRFLGMTEKLFIETYIDKYVNDVPELLSVYQGKINPFESGF